MATDDAYSQVGVILAELLGIPHATLVTKIDMKNDKLHAYRELEGGLLEHLEITLPALCTIQTGINEPRYASLLAIRRAAKKELTVVGKAEIAGENIMSHSVLDELYVPPVGKRAEMLTGSMDEITAKLGSIVKEKGLL